MKVLFNRPLLDQLLKEMGIPEEQIKSLRVVIYEHEEVGLLKRLIALVLLERILPKYVTTGAYIRSRNEVALHPYTWLDQEEATRVITHEAAHMKQGKIGGIYRILPVAIGMLGIPLIAIPVLTYLLMWVGINNHYPGLPQLVSTALQLVSLLVFWLGWEVLWKRTTDCLRSHLPQERQEREAEEFAEQALSDPRWRKIIKIESPKS